MKFVSVDTILPRGLEWHSFLSTNAPRPSTRRKPWYEIACKRVCHCSSTNSLHVTSERLRNAVQTPKGPGLAHVRYGRLPLCQPREDKRRCVLRWLVHLNCTFRNLTALAHHAVHEMLGRLRGSVTIHTCRLISFATTGRPVSFPLILIPKRY